MPRVSATLDLCRCLDWLPDASFSRAPAAPEEALLAAHTPAYLRALRDVDATQRATPAQRSRHGLGGPDNPVFPTMRYRALANAGAMLAAVRHVSDGGAAFCPGSGTHHGRPDRASGFCYLNDPVLGLRAWLQQGLSRLAYVDIDAHHGDGVEDAFADDPRVLTISLHEAGRWPRTGLTSDRSRGIANLPVPRGLNDSECRALLHAAILPLLAHHRPQAIMLQAGADSLADDPLGRLSLSNNAHRETLAAIACLAPRLIVTGGGGYRPTSTARCWSLLWADLAGFAPPDPLPETARRLLASLPAPARDRSPRSACPRRLQDAPREGHVRPDIARIAARAVE